MKAEAQTRPGPRWSRRIEARKAGGLVKGQAVPAALALCLVAGACTEPTGGSSGSSGFLANLPEEVAALAGPNQNLSAVKFNEEDGCYWYLHEGPVESTMLPLRTATGNPICVQRDAG